MKTEHILGLIVGGVAAVGIGYYLGTQSSKKSNTASFSNATGALYGGNNCPLPLVGGIAMPMGVPEPQKSMIQEQLSNLQQRANDAISRYNSCCKKTIRSK